MNSTTIGNINGCRSPKHTFLKPSPTVLGHTLAVWRSLQDGGQASITRFSGHTRRFGYRIRKQNGYDHLCSVTYLCTQILIELRPYIALDEMLVSWCFQFHDVPEGLLRRDILAPVKKQDDDLDEYLAFERLFRPLGPATWEVLQRCFLLQFVLEKTDIFPVDARAVLDELRKNRLKEALVFDGIQRYDYLFYSEECAEVGTSQVLEDVIPNQIPKLDRIARELPGFKEVVWTPQRRSYFKKYCRV